MTIAIFGHATRLAIAGGAGLLTLVAVALALARRRPGLVAAATALATGLALLLCGEWLVGRLVDAAAPRATDFNEHRWVLLSPWGRAGLVVGAAAGLAIVVLSFLASLRLASPWRRAIVVGLRAGAVVFALVLFLEPAVELRQVAREPNHVAILVDDSLSMSLRDETGGPTREARARAVLDASEPTFDRWRADHQLDFFTFSEALSPSSRREVASAPPVGKATLVRQALEQLRARYQGTDLAGVVLLSDGVPTGDLAQGGGLGAARDFIRSLDTPVHTLWTARPGLRDVAIAKILADEFGFARTVVKVEAIVRSSGYGPRRIAVTLSSEGKPMRQKWVDLAAGDSVTRVSFEFTPAKVGKYVYTIATPVADDEAVPGNNSMSFVLRVIRDKIRVLQVAGEPSWDVRALRGMLKQNPNVDLISFFILRTLDDISNVDNDELSLIPFPTQELFEEQLPSFDLIVLQNFDFLPYGIGPYMENLRAYVEGGGGLVMLGGAKSFASGDYTDTPLADALPVILPPAGQPPDRLLDTAEFQPQLTEPAMVHPITALRFEASDNLAAWRALPKLVGTNRIEGAKPDATVLAVHPTLRTSRGEPMPVIVAGQYGQGRTLAITTDSLWRWGFVAAAHPGDDGRAYLKFWDNATRWLMDDPDLRYLHVDSDRVEYAPGATAKIAVRLLNPDYTPLGHGKISLAISRGEDPATAVAVAAVDLTSNDAGEASHELPALVPGVYRVRGKAELGKRTVEASDLFLVRETSEELARPAPAEDLLQILASGSGGRYLGAAGAIPDDLAFAAPRVVRVDRRTDVELWSRAWLLFGALACLALEWALRQRGGSR